MKSSATSPLLSMIDRRALLNVMGLSAGSLFLPSLLGDRRAYAVGAPKRLWIFHTQHGPHYPLWSMRRGGADTAADWDFTLADLPAANWSYSLAPLYEHRNEINIVDGLANVVGLVDDPGKNNAHDIGNGTILTGQHIVAGGGDNRGGGPSIDQVIGKAVAQPGKRSSLYATTWGSWTPVFSGPGQPIKGVNEPAPLFDSIAGFATGGATMGTPKPIDKLALRRASLPDLVREDFKAALSKVGSEDKQKLQNHVDLIDSLQKQLKAQAESTGGGTGSVVDGAACTFGTKPGGVAQVAENAMASVKVLTAALACDVTRVAMQVHGQFGPAEFGANVGDVHQDIAHQAVPGNPAAMQMGTYYKKHAEEFAKIIAGLKAIKEGNGTMLDNTVVVWTTELANGPHDLNRIPFVMAGGCGGYFKTGRYLKYAETAKVNNRTVGPGHNKLWVSVMQAMGLPNNSFGATNTGGQDLTGVLPRLKA
ncbi:MAG: DUF1552 domain-containing protein [Deltaproteobacteria bacterium]|nr:DUF1552 domain-containing protein [Deltaproteobacteria bacterium]